MQFLPFHFSNTQVIFICYFKLLVHLVFADASEVFGSTVGSDNKWDSYIALRTHGSLLRHAGFCRVSFFRAVTALLNVVYFG